MVINKTVLRVRELRERLESCPDLRPCDRVDALFTELVRLCCSPVAAETATACLDDHGCALRRICALGECQLEAHWARRIADSPDPRAELERFPYLGNYRDLVRMELGAVTAMGADAPRRVAVLGSGPLPLTGLVLAGAHGAEVVHVDRDLTSLALGRRVARALGLGHRVSEALADLERPESEATLRNAGVGDCDVVVLAALVGEHADAKRAISARLAGLVHPDALVLVRSAVRLRSLLYPEVRAEDLTGLRVGLEVHPYTDVVNSVLVARVDQADWSYTRSVDG